MFTRISVLVLFLLAIGCAADDTSWSPPDDHPAHADAGVQANNHSPRGAMEEPAGPMMHDHDDHAAEAQGQPEHAVSTTASNATAGHDHEATSVASDDQAAHQHAGDSRADAGTANDQAQMDALYAAYLELTELLAKDDADEAKRRLASIHRLGHELSSAIDESVAGIGDKIGRAAHEDAPTIELMRERLRAVSPLVIELAAVAPPTATVREAYCPMAEASWLQTGETIANPYFGSQMLDCGTFTRTITGAHDHEESNH